MKKRGREGKQKAADPRGRTRWRCSVTLPELGAAEEFDLWLDSSLPSDWKVPQNLGLGVNRKLMHRGAEQKGQSPQTLG